MTTSTDFGEIDVTYPNGQTVNVDWNLASYVEFQKSVELMRVLVDDLPGSVRRRRER